MILLVFVAGMLFMAVYKYSLYLWLHVYAKYIACKKCRYQLHTHNSYQEVVYSDGPIEYRLRFYRKKGPTPLRSAHDENDVDITETLSMYAGPSHNFHNIPTTPKLLGYQRINVVLKGNIPKCFCENDVIVF